MAAKLDRERVRGLVEPHWRRVYNFQFRLTLDRDRAERYLADVFATAAAQDVPAEAADREVWLIGIANRIAEERLPRQPEINFDTLDETLRSEATRTDVVRSLNDPQRDYLAPRCEHVNPMNPCRCPARVGTALARGFIKQTTPPPTGEVSLRRQLVPYGKYGTGEGNDDAPMRDIGAIYGGLPEPDPPEDLGARMIAQLSA